MPPESILPIGNTFPTMVDLAEQDPQTQQSSEWEAPPNVSQSLTDRSEKWVKGDLRIYGVAAGFLTGLTGEASPALIMGTFAFVGSRLLTREANLYQDEQQAVLDKRANRKLFTELMSISAGIVSSAMLDHRLATAGTLIDVPQTMDHLHTILHGFGDIVGQHPVESVATLAVLGTLQLLPRIKQTWNEVQPLSTAAAVVRLGVGKAAHVGRNTARSAVHQLDQRTRPLRHSVRYGQAIAEGVRHTSLTNKLDNARTDAQRTLESRPRPHAAYETMMNYFSMINISIDKGLIQTPDITRTIALLRHPTIQAYLADQQTLPPEQLTVLQKTLDIITSEENQQVYQQETSAEPQLYQEYQTLIEDVHNHTTPLYRLTHPAADAPQLSRRTRHTPQRQRARIKSVGSPPSYSSYIKPRTIRH